MEGEQRRENFIHDRDRGDTVGVGGYRKRKIEKCLSNPRSAACAQESVAHSGNRLSSSAGAYVPRLISRIECNGIKSTYGNQRVCGRDRLDVG